MEERDVRGEVEIWTCKPGGGGGGCVWKEVGYKRANTLKRKLASLSHGLISLFM